MKKEKEFVEVTAWMEFRWFMYFVTGIWLILCGAVKLVSYYPDGNSWGFKDCGVVSIALEMLVLFMMGLSHDPNWRPKE